MNKVVREELKRIAAIHHGRLKPEHVVEYASDPRSVLHSRFTWDDTECGRKWRLKEAQDLIRVTVEFIGDEEPQLLTRVFVSLSSDRLSKRGYRTTVDVMSDAEMCRQLMEDAKSEMEAFTRRYARLRELTRVIRAMEKVIKKSARHKAPSRKAALAR